MATAMAVSSVFSADGLSLPRHRYLPTKVHLRSRYPTLHIRRSKKITTIIGAASTSTRRTVTELGMESTTGSGREVTLVPSKDFLKGWSDASGMPAQRILREFESLAVLVSDRIEMHKILAIQRDNWNKLFHSTITIASISAAVATAANGAAPSSGFHVISVILGMGAAALMALVSKFQPSQLAEEQRHAARFFKRLGTDIEATLRVDPRLREDASQYWKQKVGTFHALDQAFPLPLTPIVLEKFPKTVRPSKLSGDLDLSRVESELSRHDDSNGWTQSVVNDLKRTANLLRTSDIPEYVQMANDVKRINLVLAISSPLLASAAVMLNVAGCPSVAAAALTVGSLFSHTLSQALQMGAVLEVYRNCAGYYQDVERTIERSLRLPVEKREDAAVFSHKISMLLGRKPSVTPMVPLKEKKAGTLF